MWHAQYLPWKNSSSMYFCIKDWAAKKVTIFNSILAIENFRKCFNFFTYISIDYLVYEITKEFWKTTILKILQLNLSLKYWVIEAKVGFWICYCPKNWSKYHLDTIQTTFSEKNNHLGTILVKIIFFHAWKCIILGVFHRNEFWHLWGNSALICSKWLVFQNSLVISSAT